MKEAAWRNRWAGLTVACIGSGPSLVEADCERVREAGGPTVVCNTSFRVAPWADVLYAFDDAWLRVYHAEVARTFRGVVLSSSAQAHKWGAESLHGAAWFQSFGTSGTAAVALALVAGAQRIVLLGYDCRRAPDGRTHWHGSHPKPLSDARTLDLWPKKFAQLAAVAKRQGCTVLNCSRDTALTCWPRVQLASVLPRVAAPASQQAALAFQEPDGALHEGASAVQARDLGETV